MDRSDHESYKRFHSSPVILSIDLVARETAGFLYSVLYREPEIIYSSPEPYLNIFFSFNTVTS